MKRGDAEWVGIGEALEETRQSETSASEGKQTAGWGGSSREWVQLDFASH